MKIASLILGVQTSAELNTKLKIDICNSSFTVGVPSCLSINVGAVLAIKKFFGRRISTAEVLKRQNSSDLDHSLQTGSGNRDKRTLVLRLSPQKSLLLIATSVGISTFYRQKLSLMKLNKKEKKWKRSLHDRIFAVNSNPTGQSLTRGKFLFIISSASRRFPRHRQK